MPVSLERLVAEAEPGVVTDEIIREGIMVTGTDPELAEQKKRELPFGQAECLALSFRRLARISNLSGLNSLCKLQLDNNRLQAIENLGHLTNLTWLDLSFNHITAIEGLQQLTQLQDLSLRSNRITALQGLDSLASLNVLSLGDNRLADLRAVSYLVRFMRLQLLTLAGNPLAGDHDYRSYVLSHLKHLAYLDYRRVPPGDRMAAMEQHQDEMLDLHEREEAAAAEAAAAASRAAHAAAMAAANLDGVETLLDDAAAGDPEWAKLAAVPGLLEPWSDVRDKWQVATDEFKATILEAHARKQAEQAEYQAALDAALTERDAEGRALMQVYNKMHKHLMGAVAGGQLSGGVEQVLSAKVKLMALQEGLLELETDTAEAVDGLVSEFDRALSEMAAANKLQYNAYFTQVRDLQNSFFLGLAAAVPTYLERYGGGGALGGPGGVGGVCGVGAGCDNPELDGLPEEVQLMLGDRDALLNAIQSCHEVHTAKLDALEDRLVAREVGAANDAADGHAAWQEARHRDRMREVLPYLERIMGELDRAAEAAEDAEDAALLAGGLRAAAAGGGGGGRASSP